MKILVLGDVVGPSGVKAIKEKLPGLIKEKEISPTQISNQDEIQIESRSLVLIVSKEFYKPSTP